MLTIKYSGSQINEGWFKISSPPYEGEAASPEGFPQVERLPWMRGGSSGPHPLEKRYK